MSCRVLFYALIFLLNEDIFLTNLSRLFTYNSTDSDNYLILVCTVCSTIFVKRFGITRYDT